MEDGLGDISMWKQREVRLRLNPCFSGRWSRSYKNKRDKGFPTQVLILVLVEDGLGEMNLYFAHSETYKAEFLAFLGFFGQKMYLNQ